jgi:ABC-type branched-subunit amino acid transport system substrate-binding protein
MNRNSHRSMLLLAAASWVLCSAPAAARSYVIGVAAPLSGPRRSSGEMLLNALRLKADRINADGGVLGRRIELLVQDDEGTIDGARQAAVKLTSDRRVLAVIGHYDSEPAAAAVPVYTHAQVPAFLPSIGDSAVMARSPWVFGGTYDLTSEAQSMAVFIKAVCRHSSVLVFHGGDEYGRNLWGAFGAKARRVGLKVRDIEFAGAGQGLPGDFVERNLPAVPAGVDAIVVFGHSASGGALIRQLRERRISLPVYGSSRVASGDIMTAVGPYTKDLYAAFPFMFDLGNLQSVEFRKAYRDRHGAQPSVFALFAYDGLGMIAEAIRAKGPERSAIRGYLAGLDAPTSAYDGASGTLFFGKDGAMVRDTVMGLVMNGVFRPCYQQLRVVTERHTLDNLAEKVKLGEVVVSDQTPFFVIDVVYAGIEYYRIDQVAVKDLSFDAEFFLWLKWSGDVDVDNLQFLNEVPGKGYRIEMRRAIVPDQWDGGRDVRWVSYRYKGTFLHPYDLHHFPFDRQELPLLLAHKNRNANKIQLVVDMGNIVDRPIGDIYPQEWRYVGRDDFGATFRYASAFGNPTYRPGEAQAPYSVYQTTLRIQRILFPYLVTLFLPLGILIFVSLLVLLIPKEQFSSRNSLVMSSLLGVLVYHMAQARSLPQVGYLMQSDLYFVAAYMLLAFLILGVNLVNIRHSRHQEERAAWLDMWLRREFILGTLAVYVALSVYAVMVSR